ncbi:MAG TPA: hypothetical protein VN947_12860 [Polyangia bacterium]|nr:hypothetical protein [Polyangia bacterium]
MKRIVLAALSLMAIAACGGKSGTLSLNIVVSPGDDPFADAASVRFTVGSDGSHVTTVPVSMGHFSYKISFKPSDMTGPVLVEALDATGAVIAHGQSPYLLLSAIDQGPISVWVGRPGRVAPAAAALPKPVTEVSTTYVPGLGVLYAGGRDNTGAVLPDVNVYDVFTHAVISVSPMMKARAGGVAASLTGGVQSVVYGGATSQGLGSFATVDGTLELFDPTVGLGVWAPLGLDTFPARAYPTKIVLGSGAIIVSGGEDMNGVALSSAGLINPTGAIMLGTLGSPMAAPRVSHAAAAAKFPDGDGAVIFGGLQSGTTGPVAERLVGQAFAAYDVGMQDNRINATATTMPNGDVLVLGGKTASGAQASGLVITPTTPSATVTPLPNALSVAREGHTASLTGNDLVVCGGADATGTLQASCDVLDAMTYGRKSTVPLGVARRGHSAEVMETGLVVIAAGTGSDGAPLASMEIYTP